MKHKEVWLAVFLLLLPKTVMAEDVIRLERSTRTPRSSRLKQKAFFKRKYPGSDQHRHRLPDAAAQSHQRQIRTSSSTTPITSSPGPKGKEKIPRKMTS